MKASAGDRIIVKGHDAGEADRDGQILDVRGTDGGPPYRVRWEDTGQEGLFFPGPDAVVQPSTTAMADAEAPVDGKLRSRVGR